MARVWNPGLSDLILVVCISDSVGIRLARVFGHPNAGSPLPPERWFAMLLVSGLAIAVLLTAYLVRRSRRSARSASQETARSRFQLTIGEMLPLVLLIVAVGFWMEQSAPQPRAWVPALFWGMGLAGALVYYYRRSANVASSTADSAENRVRSS